MRWRVTGRHWPDLGESGYGRAVREGTWSSADALVDGKNTAIQWASAMLTSCVSHDTMASMARVEWKIWLVRPIPMGLEHNRLEKFLEYEK